MSEKVLFFSPHAAIWVHAFPEALVADAARTAGADVVYVTCGGALASFCVPMAWRGLRIDSAAADKARVCLECRNNRDLLRRGFALTSYDFESVLDAADHARIETLLDGLTPAQLTDWEVDGVKVGRAALYEYLLHHKKIELTVAEWSAFRPRLVNVLRSFLAAQRIVDRERPTRIVVYNSLYSVNAVWRAVADQRGIPVFFLHAGPGLKNRLQTLIIGRDSTVRWSERLVQSWPAHRDLPCDATELAAVTDNVAEIFRGTSFLAYSAAKSHDVQELRRRFGIGAGQKLVVAALSSYDELVAARAIGEGHDGSDLLFPTQLDWVRALVEYFVQRPELFLLIRVHPREFPNKREAKKSQHALQLERELVSLPPNVRVNWPADRVSLYDLAEDASLFLSAWSSVGREMSLLGLPVVTYAPQLLSYPADLNFVAVTAESYFAAIETALAEGWSFERIRRAYRWSVVEYVRAVIDIGDGFDFSEAPPATAWQRARGMMLAVPGARQLRDLGRRPARLREEARLAQPLITGTDMNIVPAPGDTSEAAETVALRRELRRLMQSLYGDADGPAPEGSLRQRLFAASRE